MVPGAHLPTRRSRKGGINNRAVMIGILFLLKTGYRGEYVPCELGCGIGTTGWRRLHERTQTGVWQRVHETVLGRLREHNRTLGIAPALTLQVRRPLLAAPYSGESANVISCSSALGRAVT